MSCPICKGDKLALEIYCDDGATWEGWFCLDCHHDWTENWRDQE